MNSHKGCLNLFNYFLQGMQDGFGKCVDFNAIIEGDDSVCDQHTTAVGKLNS